MSFVLLIKIPGIPLVNASIKLDIHAQYVTSSQLALYGSQLVYMHDCIGFFLVYKRKEELSCTVRLLSAQT